MSRPAISVVVLAYGPEPRLDECVAAVLASTDVHGTALGDALEVVLVDNGASEAVSTIRRDPRLRVRRMPRNIGFAGGCNVGAGYARGGTLVFVNSDAFVAPDAIATLVRALRDPQIGLVCGSVRLADAPDVVNSVGNPVHFLGVVWAGGYGEPASAHVDPVDISSATGAFFAVRTEFWNDLEGFDERYFAYHEDTELSLRVWQRGHRVRFEPGAVATHDYVFSRNPAKQYLVERNRWLTVLTVYPRSLIVAVLPAMLAFDAAVCVVALGQGWLPAKLRGYAWLVRNARWIARRRRVVQAESTMPAIDFARLLTARIQPGVLGPTPGLGVLNALLSGYWSVVRRVLR